MQTLAQNVEMLMPSAVPAATADIIDFSIHDIVSIRLINPAYCDQVAMAEFVGPPLAQRAVRPTIVIRFVDQLNPANLVYLGRNATAFAGNEFYLLDDDRGEPCVQIPFDTIGEQCEIVCRRGLGNVPLIEDIIRFALLKQGYLPLHASAVYHNGQGILVVGWTKGGKTETLLALANAGARYVGDETVYLTPDGSQMFGLALPVTLWSWHLPYTRERLPPLSRGKRVFLAAAQGLDGIHHLLIKRWSPQRLIMRLLTKFATLVNQQRKVVLAPRALFGTAIQEGPVRVDKVILALSHAADEIALRPLEPAAIAARMGHSNAYEENYFMKHYQAFCFAFPERRNEFLENALALEETLLHRALLGKECYQLVHPYPVSLDALTEVLMPFCAESSSD